MRGMRALAVIIGDGAIGLLDRQARRLARDAGTACRMHYIANVVDTLITRFESQAKWTSIR